MADSLWTQLRSALRDTVPSHVYASLVEAARFEASEDAQGRLAFADQFTKQSFEEKCWPVLEALLRARNLDPARLELVVSERPLESEPTAYSYPVAAAFDGRYTFDNFVVGGTNQFAYAAAQAVAKQPGECYNPLFIFGGAGLGKTHLLKAIGYEAQKRRTDPHVIFRTSESFTNELIHALRMKQMREFQEKYRTHCDVLLIDDVHFLAGKERTQEEFFYTFNFLHEANKQIVVTSDRYPKDIQGLESRLQTRFEWGLVADVQPPDIETRIAILKNKADRENIEVPDAVAHYLAAHVTTNVRELEGSLHRIRAYAALSGVQISLTLAQQLFRDLTPKTADVVSADGILKLCALHFGVKVIDLRSDKRIRKLTVPRQVCMYLLRKRLLMSYPEIGKFMGGKDHTTILHGVSRIAEQLRSDGEIVNAVTTIEGLLR